jgi:hypothetical protein
MSSRRKTIKGKKSVRRESFGKADNPHGSGNVERSRRRTI